jgi:acetolactate synthase-1/2/3 large subunit
MRMQRARGWSMISAAGHSDGRIERHENRHIGSSLLMSQQSCHRPTVAETVARVLIGAGIRHVFGIPGGEDVEYVEALRRAGIQFILTRHEEAAALMADAYARLSRRPAVCLSTLGPGAVNLLSGVAQAFLERSLLIAITTQVPAKLSPWYTHQRLDLHALYAPVTKLTVALGPENAERRPSRP